MKIQRLSQSKRQGEVVIRKDILDKCFNKVISNQTESEQMENCLNLIDQLDNYKGKGISAFLKKFIFEVGKVFPKVQQRLFHEIQNTEEIIYRTNSPEYSLDINTKEILIKLINTILMAINEDLTKTGSNSSKFNDSLSPLDPISISFHRERNCERKLKVNIQNAKKMLSIFATPISGNQQIHIDDMSSQETYKRCLEEEPF